jgi:2-keto-4-pentenoate hydratase/2-oxohepta-3-ene-1,7-dioic acid hydratase in catechol pathway
MKLCRFASPNGIPSLGIVDGDEVVDLSGADVPAEPAAALAATGRSGLEGLAEAAPRLALADVQLLAPAMPRKYLAIALNYADHIAEMGMEAPEVPVFFNKQVTCVTGPGTEVHMPKVSTLLDYEAELALVIGKRCRHVPVEQAHEVIAGYTCANDLSVRDWQGRAQTMTIGKSFDTHGPLGPWLVTPEEIGDPQDLRVRCYVNDELRQDASTAEMVFDCFQQVSHLSEGLHARARRRDRHRHPGRRRHRPQADPRERPPRRRHGAGRDRANRRTGQRRGARARRFSRQTAIKPGLHQLLHLLEVKVDAVQRRCTSVAVA